MAVFVEAHDDEPGLDLSASDLRFRVATGRSVRYLTPRAVEAYITQHGLYRETVP